MCVAILQKSGELSGAQLYAGWRVNRDGGGFAYLDDDKKVQISTGFMQYNDFEKAYRKVVKRYGTNGPMLVHMRIRSAGGMGPKNCHPFRIKGGAMIHNGTMFQPSEDGKDAKSDTRIFAESLYNILDIDSVKKAERGILRSVGYHNKLCFLYDGGDYYIVNEERGYWSKDNTVWFSNSSCNVSDSYPSLGQ
jgi:predicted glutamine amidotransferase